MTQASIELDSRTADAELIRRALLRDKAAIRAIIQKHNRRLYRTARSIVKDDGEAEDVLQEAYMRAFLALPKFRAESSLATWLTRIVINEALQYQRRRRDLPSDTRDLQTEPGEIIPFPMQRTPPQDPERAMAQRQLCQLVERAIDRLPLDYRIVIIARAIEGLSVEETSDTLGVRPETVKTRLHRARALLRSTLAEDIGVVFDDVFPFDGHRCNRLTETVIARLIKQ